MDGGSEHFEQIDEMLYTGNCKHDFRRLEELGTNLVDHELKISIESANSDEKSANKSADNMTLLTKRQEQILTIMEEGYTTEAIAGIIGLKCPRTRQLMNELVELGKVESIGTTKDRRYFDGIRKNMLYMNMVKV